MPESHRTMGPIAYSPGSSFIACPGDDGYPDTWEVPQTPHHSSTFLLDFPATAVTMNPTAGITESDTFWGTSGNAPGMSAQHAQPQGLPVRNTQSRTRVFFSRILRLRWLSARGEESGEIATRCGNPVAAAPGVGARSRHVSATRDPTTLNITRGTDESVIPGCSLCCMG
ncbi:hypothetical protein EDD16DRAFT_1669254 [Pisolithus croceorrhizus]|nr:hypothetical protein EDD16DRAFT_1669254 [Pisolithus croceorrhizus]